MRPINVADYETLAAQVVPPHAWDYVRGGGGDELTLRDNLAAFGRIPLRPRVLVGAAAPHLHTTILGTPSPMPLMIAPVGYQRLVHFEGELAVARAARAVGIPMVAATLATTPMEEIAAQAGPIWFQLYVFRDMGFNRALLDRARACGCRVVVITVDAPRLGQRDRDARNGFALPPHVRAAHLPPEQAETLNDGDAGESAIGRHAQKNFDDALDWERIDQLRAMTDLPIVLKGILTEEDARIAARQGVAGVVVSNHGGRQLDGVLASVDALPEVVEGVEGRCEVYLDGGIRRGTDILKALALGAKAVLIGRPVLWALAAGGAEGVAHMLDLLRNELELAMILSGRRSLADVDMSLVRRVGG